jgi:transposase-like protein
MPEVRDAALGIGFHPAAASGLGTARDQAARDGVPAASADLPMLSRDDLCGAASIRRVFDADEPAEAERRLREIVTRYQKPAPLLAAWLEENVPEALTVLHLPAAHRRRLRTTNGLERLNKEIKRRTRVATLFPNEASLLRLASAVLSEISDDWETERAYLTMET